MVKEADSLQEAMLLSEKTPLESKIVLIRQAVADNESQGGDSTQVLGLFKKILSQPQETSDMAEPLRRLHDAEKRCRKTPSRTFSRRCSPSLPTTPRPACSSYRRNGASRTLTAWPSFHVRHSTITPMKWPFITSSAWLTYKKTMTTRRSTCCAKASVRLTDKATRISFRTSTQSWATSFTTYVEE